MTDITPAEPPAKPTVDDLEAAIEARLTEVRPQVSSYDQGRSEELQWVLDQISPPQPEPEPALEAAGTVPPTTPPVETPPAPAEEPSGL